MAPIIKTFFDEGTNNATHVVREPGGLSCAVIDSVLDFDLASGRTSTRAADLIVSHIRREGLQVEWILETHVHADHLTAAPYIKDRLGGRVGIGAGVVTVQEAFAAIYNTRKEFRPDGSQFDHLFGDGETLSIGGMTMSVMHTPGHTPACASYVLGDAVFAGDTFFMPDAGTARCDFPGGSARQLYRSLQRILSLPEGTRLFVNHDYGLAGDRAVGWETTVGDQKTNNIHVGGGKSEDDFIAMRDARDATLSMPNLILPAIQVNMRAGHLPDPEDNGTRYLKIPLNLFGG